MLAVAVLVAVLAYSQWTYWESFTEKQRVVAQSAFPIVGKQAPDFSLPALGGGYASLSDYAGRPLVINFWATWCKICKKAFPLFETFSNDYGDRIAFLSICSGTTVEKAVEIAQEYAVSFSILYDEGKRIARAYQPQEATVRREITAFPFTVFVDQNGVVVHAKVGNFASLEDMLSQMVAAEFPIDQTSPSIP